MTSRVNGLLISAQAKRMHMFLCWKAWILAQLWHAHLPGLSNQVMVLTATEGDEHLWHMTCKVLTAVPPGRAASIRSS